MFSYCFNQIISIIFLFLPCFVLIVFLPSVDHVATTRKIVEISSEYQKNKAQNPAGKKGTNHLRFVSEVWAADLLTEDQNGNRFGTAAQIVKMITESPSKYNIIIIFYFLYI